mgnify:CR=1 FL=1
MCRRMSSGRLISGNWLCSGPASTRARVLRTAVWDAAQPPSRRPGWVLRGNAAEPEVEDSDRPPVPAANIANAPVPLALISLAERPGSEVAVILASEGQRYRADKPQLNS